MNTTDSTLPSAPAVSRCLDCGEPSDNFLVVQVSRYDYDSDLEAEDEVTITEWHCPLCGAIYH